MAKRNSKYLATPYLLWMVIFFILPLILVLFFALFKDVNGKLIFSTEFFAKVFEPIYISVFLKSFKLAIISTIICLILGYPIAFILASKEFSKMKSLIFLFVLPMWMNYLLRTYSWLNLLETNGIINHLLSFVDPVFAFFKSDIKLRIDILYTDKAVLLGMVYNFIPFMILPIYTVLNKMDDSLIEAAEDLGANPFQVFLKVTLPLSVPGIVSGITMVFLPAVTTFVISTILGGGHNILIGNLIEKQFLTLDDWNFGSALSFVLMIIILISMSILSIFDKDNKSEGRGALF